MNPQFFYSPDNTEAKATSPSLSTGASSTVTNVKAVNRKPFIPNKQADLADVAVDVSNNWKSYPKLTLMWITQADFADEAQTYAAQISTTLDVGSNQSPNSSTLKVLDKKIDTGISKIRKRLNSIYDEPVVYAQYSRYGLHKKRGHYKYPTDRDTRLLNLDLIIKSIVEDGLDKFPDYGTAFWTKMKTDYSAALGKESSTNQALSGLVGKKTVTKAHIREVLICLWDVIKGNYRGQAYSTALSMGYRKKGQ